MCAPCVCGFRDVNPPIVEALRRDVKSPIRRCAFRGIIRHMPRASTVNPVKRLRWLVKLHHSQQAAASSLGISPSYFSDLLHGKRDCSERVLDMLSLQRVIVQRPGAPRRGR